MSADIEKPNLKAAKTPQNTFDIDDIWKIVSENIRLYISKREYDSWFGGVYLSKIENGMAEISCDQGFKREWLEMYHRAVIRKSLLSATGQNLELVFTVRSSFIKDITPEDTSETVSIFQMPTKAVDPENKSRRSQLNPKYRFANFVVGAHNKLAYAVAEAVVADLGRAYNPVFYYGPTGVGKTHLMQSIGNEILQKYPDKKVMYVPIEQFLNEMIDSIRGKTNEVFRKKYREIDLLIIDDIQFVETYAKTQEELFNTFNSLYLANKQIVLAADRPPREIKNLTDRLRSRFEGGMVADIQSPDIETRMAILKYLLEEKGVSIETEILELIAKNIESNVRELEGAITKILSMSKFGEEPNAENIAKYLQFDIESKRKRIKPERVIDAVCEVFDVTQKEIKGKSRTSYLARARQVIMYLLREELQLPLEKVAKEVNRKDHTTVLHACEKIGEMIEKEVRFKEKIEKCKALLA
ncbi:chromosomal replication initiator protein DnaA [bacterium]|nr:chromosomal replication initiator protein DnaA [bacterium]